MRAGVNILSGTIAHPAGKLNIRNRTQFGDYDRFHQNYVPGAGDQFASLTTITQQVEPEKFTNYEFGVKRDVRRYLTIRKEGSPSSCCFVCFRGYRFC